MFEIVGLAIFTPGAAIIFDQPVMDMGVIGLISATVATLWNFLYNIGFDHAMNRITGSVRWYLDISIIDALIMDLAIVLFYLVYAFFFNIAYDHIFPVKSTSHKTLTVSEVTK